MMKNKLNNSHSLRDSNPTLAMEWHPTKNFPLSPSDVKPKSNKKVWWKCSKEHEWIANINDRNGRGRGCPYCSGRLATPEDNLAIKYPKVAKELHPSKNEGIDPFNLKPKTSRKLWWLCPKGHEYQAVVSSRTAGSGCPYCAGQAVNEENSLASLSPDIAKEWNAVKNKNKKPSQYSFGSGKAVWWKCKHKHEWKTSIHNRTTKGSRCPYCTGKKASPENNLTLHNPELVLDWNFLNNGSLKPEDYLPFSSKKVWWKCFKGHEWQATIASRNRGNGCPWCSGKILTDDNNLAYLHPYLVEEWDCIKNGDLTPEQVFPGTHKRAWWTCSFGHSWRTAVYNRVNGRGCPFCTKQTSKLEVRVYTELTKMFSDVGWREKIDGLECDVLLRKHKVAIEIDGFYYHKDKIDKDRRKTGFLEKHGIFLIRLREEGLGRLSKTDVYFSQRDQEIHILIKLLAELSKQPCFTNLEIKKIESYIKRKQLQNTKEFREIWSALPAPPQGKSLIDTHPHLGQDWHSTKNAPLTPELFLPKSHHKIWWQCKSGHEWQAPIYSRASGIGCPGCSGQAVTKDNNLAVMNPTVANDWNYKKNAPLKPENFTLSSGRKVWWICSKGHEWEATIASRNSRTGCPGCSGRMATKENNVTINPLITAEWNYKLNDNLNPQNFPAGSHKRVWWICEKGHEWEAEIRTRFRGHGCLRCFRERSKPSSRK